MTERKRPSRQWFNGREAQKARTYSLTDEERMHQEARGLPLEEKVLKLRELLNHLDSLAMGSNRPHRGTHRLRLDIAHQIAKLTRETPDHEADAYRLREVAKDSVEAVFPPDFRVVLQFAGIPLAESARSEDLAVNFDFAKWGVKVANRAIQRASLVQDSPTLETGKSILARLMDYRTALSEQIKVNRQNNTAE